MGAETFILHPQGKETKGETKEEKELCTRQCSALVSTWNFGKWEDTASQFCRSLCLMLWGQPMAMGAALYHRTDKEPAEILA